MSVTELPSVPEMSDEPRDLKQCEALIDLARVVAGGNCWPMSLLKLVHFVRCNGHEIESELLS